MLPIKGGLFYFFCLLIALICSIIVRLDLIFRLNLDIPDNLILFIKVFSVIYTCILFFNYLIISKHAYNLITIFSNKIKDISNYSYNSISNKRKVIIQCTIYYLYYIYISLITSLVLYFNFISVVNINKLNLNINITNPHYYYFISLFI